jgi:hypothetical protein
MMMNCCSRMKVSPKTGTWQAIVVSEPSDELRAMPRPLA